MPPSHGDFESLSVLTSNIHAHNTDITSAPDRDDDDGDNNKNKQQLFWVSFSFWIPLVLGIAMI